MKNRVKVYAVLKLIKLIKNIYEEPEIPLSEKRRQREELTRGFINECINRFNLPKEEIVKMVDNVLEQERWIKEIEDEEEAMLDEEEIK